MSPEDEALANSCTPFGGEPVMSAMTNEEVIRTEMYEDGYADAVYGRPARAIPSDEKLRVAYIRYRDGYARGLSDADAGYSRLSK